ncbi:MAG: OmpH/Skp family outer membrane protein [Planctomycetota bacterium]|jgi:Skp family chaperone for outer membrane proteins
MNSMKPSMHTILPAAILVVLAIVFHDALAARPQAPRAAVIATVDLAALLEGLQQRSAADAAFQTLRDKTMAERQTRESEIAALKAQFADAVEPAARQQLEEEIALDTIELQFWEGLKSNELDVEWSLGRRDLYRNIQKAAKKMAEMQGYDLVIIDDSKQEFAVMGDANVPRRAQLLQQMRMRRLLHASPALDITNDLIAAMNNAYTTGTQAP